MPPPEVRARLDDHVAAWAVVVDHIVETDGSLLAFGRRNDQPVVLKVVKARGDEWRSGEILEAFEGRSVVRAYEHAPGAVLLEHLSPALPLAKHALSGADADATRVLTETIRAMSPRPPAAWVPTVAAWGTGFERYAVIGDTRIPRDLVKAAHRVYGELCRSQSRVRLLHGDLHHHNILFDERRGWLAVDPKGVVGEIEYEAGAALRNPYERPALFSAPSTVEQRVARIAGDLAVNASRVLSWAFAQAVLAAIWAVEDGERLEHDNGWIALAETLRPLVMRR